jgi:hypothetical protein
MFLGEPASFWGNLRRSAGVERFIAARIQRIRPMPKKIGRPAPGGELLMLAIVLLMNALVAFPLIRAIAR